MLDWIVWYGTVLHIKFVYLSEIELFGMELVFDIKIVY